MITIAVILASTRPGRSGAAVAHWVMKHASQRDDARFELVDLAEVDLPPLDEPRGPRSGQYTHEHTRSWAQTIAGYDGFLFVTPEYNHSAPGSLKNALDRLYAEWNNKAAGFVSYGVYGGVCAVDSLRPVLSHLEIADVGAQVALSMHTDFTNYTDFTPAERQTAELAETLDQLIAWSAALAPLRATA
ncbi:NAD(P)H-dependent oxidoreductase [Streptomyces sp. NPDC013178]|uniref:NADPH-dependent FMN reductase n=1 Tax=Streptomyces sp. NPDC013178 TaxID=3155118 RepID=UPI0033FF6D99